MSLELSWYFQVEKFSNWAATQIRECILACHPTKVEEVQAVIRGARKLGLSVRAAGRTHSWTPLFSDEGQVVMYVRDLQRPDGPQMELLLVSILNSLRCRRNTCLSNWLQIYKSTSMTSQGWWRWLILWYDRSIDRWSILFYSDGTNTPHIPLV